jgi:putative membrane protein
MLWVKALHIISIVCWFAALFYLPRLFVYHVTATDAISNERFKVMERRLYYGIMVPSAFFTILFGAWLISYNPKAYTMAGWFHAKMALVFLLLIFHLYCGACRKRFAQDDNTHSEFFYRVFNEVPSLVLVGAVILVEVKPF